MLVAVGILFVYAWSRYSTSASVAMTLYVNDLAAGVASLTLIVSFIAYLWAPRNGSGVPALGVYLLLAASSGVLIVTNGGSESPFVALWMVVAVFAGVFGMFGIVPLLAATLGYLAMELSGGSLTRGDVITTVLVGQLPLVVSYVLWHQQRRRSTDAPGTRAYRQLASELSQVTGKSEVVINAIADGVIALDSKGAIELLNPAAQHIIGWGKQDALSLNYQSVLQLRNEKGEELTPSTDPIAQVLASNKEIDMSYLQLITNSGKKRLIALTISPVGQVGDGVIVVFRDVTNERQEERAQAEFISTASHEMRTPVASIEGYLGLALNPQTAQVDPKAREFIGKAQQSAQHLGRLFQDLLDVSRADDGRLVNRPKVIDLVEFVGEVVQGLQPKAVEKNLRMIFKPDPDGNNKPDTNDRRLSPVYYVNVDPDHLREVVANLVENAIKYTPKGDVAIDISGTQDRTTISVTDSGIGIAAEDIPHLFQKFYRIDNSATREIGGTGLGLYLCRRLTEAMEGRIWVESQLQQGSTFFVELPRVSHEDATRMIEAAAMTPTIEPTPTITPPIMQTETVAQTTVGTPPSTPQPHPAVAPVAPSPAVTPAAPVATPPQPSAQTPTPSLATIEQNPNQYLQQSRSESAMRIPVRDDNNQP